MVRPSFCAHSMCVAKWSQEGKGRGFRMCVGERVGVDLGSKMMLYVGGLQPSSGRPSTHSRKGRTQRNNSHNNNNKKTECGKRVYLLLFIITWIVSQRMLHKLRT